MDKIILFPVSLEELKTLISESINIALESRANLLNKPVEEDPLLSIKEVQKILSVSKVTIHKWKKKGLITYHKLNRRLYFKKSEILNAVKKSSIKN